MMIRRTLAMLAMTVLALGVFGCSSTTKPVTESGRDYLRDQAQASLKRLHEVNVQLGARIDDAYAYAVFPEVTKGAVGIGGAHGRGVVYEQGNFIGYTEMSQGTIGVQLGGQSYAEVILFEDKATLERFKRGNVEFAAQASAVAADKASSADANYEHGVLVYTMGKGGLMFEAALGGQKFNYSPA